MSYSVFVLSEAEKDIVDIYNYILNHESEKCAETILAAIEKSVKELSVLPNRGHMPPELARINIAIYQEVHCKNFRIIYEVENSKVYIYAVLDSRRDLQELLELRLLR